MSKWRVNYSSKAASSSTNTPILPPGLSNRAAPVGSAQIQFSGEKSLSHTKQVAARNGKAVSTSVLPYDMCLVVVWLRLCQQQQ